MSYKLGFILSLLFLVNIFVFAGDLLSVQIIYTNLDAVSVVAGNIISSKGGITQEVSDLVYDQAKATIIAISDENPMFGDVFEYKIARNFDPKFISKDTMEISIVRSVVIGYYN